MENSPPRGLRSSCIVVLSAIRSGSAVFRNPPSAAFCGSSSRPTHLRDAPHWILEKGLLLMNRQKRRGFSLIEMVIVILILGIIAAVAAPRMFDTAATAEQNTTRQQLAVLRNAIEMYRARSGIYPGNGDLPTAMATMLNGPFPAPSIGSVRGDCEVYYDADADASTPVSPNTAQAGGWAYKAANGSLKLNVDSNELGSEW